MRGDYLSLTPPFDFLPQSAVTGIPRETESGIVTDLHRSLCL